MATDLIGAYQDALKSLTNARGEAERVANIIVDAGVKLHKWEVVMISNGQRGFPPEIALPGSGSINRSTWPTADQLENALADYHQALHSAQNAWSAIPSESRIGLQEPTGRR